MPKPEAILVIDDEAGIREGCRRVLTLQQWEVEVASNGEEGISRLRSRPFDLVLLDILMPGISGMELLDAIHNLNPEIVTIIITGYATVDLATQAIKRGAYDFIPKPFDSDTLLMAVNQGLEKRRLSLEAKRARESEAHARRLQEEKAQLETLDQIKSRFTLLVAHELRAPVAAIQSYLKLILDGYVPPERLTEIITKAERRAQDQLALINDLLELARITDRARPADVCSVNVVEALLEARDMMRAQAAEKGIVVETVVDADIPLVQAQPKHLRELWNNLLSNAIKYTPTGGRVTVAVRLDPAVELAGGAGAAIVGRVEDTGIGIAPEEIGEIFQDFYRTPAAKEFEHMGTGLGLSIVKAILDTYGGSIQVTSTVGTGSTFTFVLPVHCPPAV